VGCQDGGEYRSFVRRDLALADGCRHPRHRQRDLLYVFDGGQDYVDRPVLTGRNEPLQAKAQCGDIPAQSQFNRFPSQLFGFSSSRDSISKVAWLRLPGGRPEGLPLVPLEKWPEPLVRLVDIIFLAHSYVVLNSL
jgi:hypothetical protein